MFSQSYFSLPMDHNTLDNLCHWKCLSFLLLAYFGRIYDKKDILDWICKKFRSKEKAYSNRVNDYFGPRRTNIPHEKPNYGPLKSKFEVDYYI